MPRTASAATRTRGNNALRAVQPATEPRSGSIAVPPAAPVKYTARPLPKSLSPELTPGLRDRLLAQMNESGIPAEGRIAYLRLMTGRAPQSVRRWIAEDSPGLPDLESFTRLCVCFDTDSNWFLGLSDIKYHLPRDRTESHGTAESAAWIDDIVRQIAEKAAGCQPFYMPGDEMEPRIQKGAPILVNTAIKQFEANGIYVLDYQGRTIVRIVEHRLGEGLVLACENKKYKETLLKDAETAKQLGLSVIGKAEFCVQLTPT